MAYRISERATIFLMAILLGFLTINFDPHLGLAFTILIVISIFMFLTDKKLTYQIESKPNKVKSFGFALIGFLTYLFISRFALGLTSFNSVLLLLSDVQPVFEGSMFFTFLAFGLLVPVVESRLFFGTLLEYGSDFLKTRLRLTDTRTWALFIIIAVSFVFFHLTAKFGAGAAGFTNSLILVFIFAIVSCVLVILEGQILSAILMHIIANVTALVMKFNLVSNISGAILWGGAAAIGYLIITKKLNILNIRKQISGG